MTFSLLAVSSIVDLVDEAAKPDPPQPAAEVTCLVLMSYFVTTAVLAAERTERGTRPH